MNRKNDSSYFCSTSAKGEGGWSWGSFPSAQHPNWPDMVKAMKSRTSDQQSEQHDHVTTTSTRSDSRSETLAEKIPRSGFYSIDIPEVQVIYAGIFFFNRKTNRQIQGPHLITYTKNVRSISGTFFLPHNGQMLPFLIQIRTEKHKNCNYNCSCTNKLIERYSVAWHVVVFHNKIPTKNLNRRRHNNRYSGYLSSLLVL